MKIIRLIPVLDFGGVETTFLLEAEHIDRSRVDFQVCTFWKAGDTARRIEALGIKVDCLDVDPSIRNPRATMRLRSYLQTEKPDIVHASIGEANIHAALGGFGMGAAIILEEQGYPDRKLTGRLAHAALYRLVDAVVGVSQASCDYVVEREWAPRSKVHLIYNAIDDRFIKEPLPRIRRDGRFRFITVGRLADVKNHEGLIRAFARTVGVAPHASLTIVGEGPLRGKLEALIDELGLGGSVTLAGFQPDVLPLLDDSDAFLLPSFSEGFGIAAAEAMARRLPVIVSDVGSLQEVVHGIGEEWLLAPTHEEGWFRQMVRLATMEESDREELADKARQAAERFSVRRLVESLQALYSSLRPVR